MTIFEIIAVVFAAVILGIFLILSIVSFVIAATWHAENEKEEHPDE